MQGAYEAPEGTLDHRYKLRREQLPVLAEELSAQLHAGFQQSSVPDCQSSGSEVLLCHDQLLRGWESVVPLQSQMHSNQMSLSLLRLALALAWDANRQAATGSLYPCIPSSNRPCKSVCDTCMSSSASFHLLAWPAARAVQEGLDEASRPAVSPTREQSRASMLPEQLMWSEQHSWFTFDGHPRCLPQVG